ncbi:hypothetical protein [Rudaea sp.]|nr:hypothetical protein [Rudaea sp.]
MADPAATTLNHVSTVVCAASEVKMIGVAAGWIIAVMANESAL